MDVLKKQLNDIGSCIGYPFYFFEDGSYSKSYVNGKMNAIMVVKKPFADVSGDCFFVDAKANKVAQETIENASPAIDDIKIQKPQSKEEQERAEKVREISFYVACGWCPEDDDIAFLIKHGDVQIVKKIIDTCWKQKYWRDGCFWVSKDNSIGLDYPKSVIALIEGGHVDIIKDFFGNMKNNFAYLGREVIFSLYRYGAPELIKYVWSTTSGLWGWGIGGAFVQRKDINLYKAYRKYIGEVYDRVEFQEVVLCGTVDMFSVFLNCVPRNDNNDGLMMYFLIENGSADMIKTFIHIRGLSDQWRDMLAYAERKEVRSVVGAA